MAQFLIGVLKPFKSHLSVNMIDNNNKSIIIHIMQSILRGIITVIYKICSTNTFKLSCKKANRTENKNSIVKKFNALNKSFFSLFLLNIKNIFLLISIFDFVEIFY